MNVMDLMLMWAKKNMVLQKWSKGKQKEKVNNMVLFDKATYDKLLSEAPKYKLITPSILSDRLRVNLLFDTASSSSFMGLISLSLLPDCILLHFLCICIALHA